MRVEAREPEDPTRERLAVVPDSTEDLWHLQYVIEPGDRVAAQTSRRLQREDDQMRDTGGTRETIHATIEVDEVEFQRFADRLRVGGEIVASSREDQLGFHHTINVDVHDEIELEKRFKPDQRARLEEAESATGDPAVLVVTIEEGRADVFDVAQSGANHRTTLVSGSGKRSGESTRQELFAEVGDLIARSDADAIVFAGPGFVKEDCLDYLQDEHVDGADHIRTVDTSATGERGVHEVLTRGVIDDVRSETRLAAESTLVTELLERLRTEPATVTYGPEETATAIEYGAVETLAVVDDVLLRERTDESEWAIDLDGLVERVQQQGGTVTVLTAEGEPGQQVESLGGIAALLRYPID